MPQLKLNKRLLLGFQAGRRESLEIVYRTYEPSVRAFVRGLAHRTHSLSLCVPSVQDDVVQDVFTRAFSERARLAYDGDRDYGPYLKAIARNLMLDMMRCEERERERERVVYDDQLHGLKATEDSTPYDSDVFTAIRSYLNDLPDPIHSVYVQRFVLGHSQQLACAVLGVTRRCLRTREAHLTRGLRQQLQSRGLSADCVRETRSTASLGR